MLRRRASRYPATKAVSFSKATRLLAVPAFAALLVASLATVRHGGSATTWSHWWCAPGARAVHGAGGSGGSLLRALEVHWPHFLPILLGLVTLVYLWRANARWTSSMSA